MDSNRDEKAVSVIVGPQAGAWAAWRDMAGPQQSRVRAYVVYLVLMTLLFSQPLARLMLYAAQNALHSHIPLVPLVVAYLLYTQKRVSAGDYRMSLGGATSLIAIGLAALGARTWWGGSLSVNDELALMAFAFVCVVAAGGFLFLGAKWMASAAFPISFLLFMVPMPDAVANALEIASMRASADVAAWFLKATGTPLLRDGQTLVLPGVVLWVAQECSGIRSSWVLFITSLLASHVLLKSAWRRVVLVAFVIPLGIVRNGFRILVIGLLCVHVGPHMIDSPVHHQGGPLFFGLSLGPFFLFSWWLRRRES